LVAEGLDFNYEKLIIGGSRPLEDNKNSFDQDHPIAHLVWMTPGSPSVEAWRTFLH
jgi:hypothetical protein